MLRYREFKNVLQVYFDQNKKRVRRFCAPFEFVIELSRTRHGGHSFGKVREVVHE